MIRTVDPGNSLRITHHTKVVVVCAEGVEPIVFDADMMSERLNEVLRPAMLAAVREAFPGREVRAVE